MRDFIHCVLFFFLKKAVVISEGCDQYYSVVLFFCTEESLRLSYLKLIKIIFNGYSHARIAPVMLYRFILENSK